VDQPVDQVAAAGYHRPGWSGLGAAKFSAWMRRVGFMIEQLFA
jgi:hypothetical protein